MQIRFDHGRADEKRARVGRIIVQFDRERAVVELMQEKAWRRRTWIADLPIATWTELAEALERCGFPNAAAVVEPPPARSFPTTITANVHGRVEAVTIGEAVGEYRDVTRLAWAVVAQVAPELAHGLPDTRVVPDARVDNAREVTGSGLVTALEHRMMVERNVKSEFVAYFNGDDRDWAPETLDPVLEQTAAESAGRLRAATPPPARAGLVALLHELRDEPRHPINEKISNSSLVPWNDSDEMFSLFSRLVNAIIANIGPIP